MNVATACSATHACYSQPRVLFPLCHYQKTQVGRYHSTFIMKRNQPIIDLTADSDGDDTNAISNATSSTSRIPPPQTSKESKSRKRTRAGERSKSASRSNSTNSTRSSSVVSAHSTQQQPHKGKSKPVQEAQEAPHDDIDGRPVFNNLTCPICFDVVSNACTTACVSGL